MSDLIYIPIYSSLKKSFSITAIFLVMFFGITGNASIIIIILKNKLLRLQPINLFLLNLAISDLLHLCIGPFFYMFKRNAILTNFYMGEIGCLATPFFRGNSYLIQLIEHPILRIPNILFVYFFQIKVLN